MTKEEFINEINNNKYYSLQYVQTLFIKPFCGIKLVEHGLHYSTHYSHCWYSTAVNVYKLEDGYVGVEGVNNCSVSRSYEDVGILCTAFPMKKVETYVKE